MGSQAYAAQSRRVEERPAVADDAHDDGPHRGHAIDLAWRFQYGDADVSAIASSLETLEGLCLRGGPSKHAGNRVGVGLPFTQRQLDAIDRSRRVDAILGRLTDRHVAALRAKYGDPDVPESVACVFPYDGAVPYVTAALEQGFAATTGRAARSASELGEWLEAACARIHARSAQREDEKVLTAVGLEAPRLVEEALEAYAVAAGQFDAHDQRLWLE